MTGNKPAWDMTGWPADEQNVAALVMAVEGCGTDETPLIVVGRSGRVLPLTGVDRDGGTVTVIVDDMVGDER
jgi:hypothetical protein